MKAAFLGRAASTLPCGPCMRASSASIPTTRHDRDRSRHANCFTSPGPSGRRVAPSIPSTIPGKRRRPSMTQVTPGCHKKSRPRAASVRHCRRNRPSRRGQRSTRPAPTAYPIPTRPARTGEAKRERVRRLHASETAVADDARARSSGPLVASARRAGPQALLRRARCTAATHAAGPSSVHLDEQVFQCFDAEVPPSGDVIDLWSKLHHMPLREAALDLMRTFCLEPSSSPRGPEKRNG